MKDYYAVLSLKPKTSLSKIQKRHRELAQDFLYLRKKGENVTFEFIDESEAFYVLKNVNRKQIYDALYGMYYQDKVLKERKIVSKWKTKIQNAAKKGREYGEKLATMSDEELRKVLAKKKKKRSTGWLFTILEIVVEFFFNIFSFA